MEMLRCCEKSVQKNMMLASALIIMHSIMYSNHHCLATGHPKKSGKKLQISYNYNIILVKDLNAGKCWSYFTASKSLSS